MLATIPITHGLGAKALAACLGTAFALVLTAGLIVATDLLTGIGELWGGSVFWLALLVHVPLSVAAYRSALRLPGR